MLRMGTYELFKYTKKKKINKIRPSLDLCFYLCTYINNHEQKHTIPAYKCIRVCLCVCMNAVCD